MQEALIVKHRSLVVVLALVVIVGFPAKLACSTNALRQWVRWTIDQGPKVGDPQPDHDALGDRRRRSQCRVRAGSEPLFFLSPTCPVCKKLLPILKSIRIAEMDWLDIVLAMASRPSISLFIAMPAWPTSRMSC